jgi:peroxiredoxin family protein
MNQLVFLFFIITNSLMIFIIKKRNLEQEKVHNHNLLTIHNQMILEKKRKNKINDSINQLAEIEETTQHKILAIKLKLEILHHLSKTNF